MSHSHPPSVASSTPAAVISVAPIVLPGGARGADLHVRVSAPIAGEARPLLLFSHGSGQSHRAYAPLADHWAAHGFVVIQPTHLDARMFGLAPDDPRLPDFWRHREEDLLRVLDGLDLIETAAPILAGRLDRTRIAVAGHSWGAQTASTLLGARHPDPRDGRTVDRRDERIKAGVLLTLPGSGGEHLNERAATAFPFMHPDFSTMTAPALMVMGDRDQSRMTARGPDWWRDGYDLSPAPKALFTVFGGEHSLGGIPGYEARETTDERLERVAAIQLLSTAFLRSALDANDPAWCDAVAALSADATPEGRIETK